MYSLAVSIVVSVEIRCQSSANFIQVHHSQALQEHEGSQGLAGRHLAATRPTFDSDVKSSFKRQILLIPKGCLSRMSRFYTRASETTVSNTASGVLTPFHFTHHVYSIPAVPSLSFSSATLRVTAAAFTRDILSLVPSGSRLKYTLRQIFDMPVVAPAISWRDGNSKRAPTCINLAYIYYNRRRSEIAKAIGICISSASLASAEPMIGRRSRVVHEQPIDDPHQYDHFEQLCQIKKASMLRPMSDGGKWHSHPSSSQSAALLNKLWFGAKCSSSHAYPTRIRAQKSQVLRLLYG